MNYYNPETKKELPYREVCALYSTSFPRTAETLAGVWHKIHEVACPPPEPGYRFERGEVSSVDGLYIRTWKKTPLDPEEKQSIALATSLHIINSSMARAHVQTASFSAEEFAAFIDAGLFDEWAPDVQYSKGFRLVADGIVYEVQQDVLSVESQPPFAAGMLSVYRPLSVDPDSGDEPQGTKDSPIPFIYGMDVGNGLYYSYEGKLYLAKTDMLACVWYPGTQGLWQWEEVK